MPDSAKREVYLVIRPRLYVCVLVIAVVNALLLLATRAELILKIMPVFVSFGVALAVLTFACYRSLKLSESPHRALTLLFHVLEGLLFLHIVWLNLRLFNHLTMMVVALPYTDAMLLRWDEMLGFDWTAYFVFFHDHPTLLMLLDYCYSSLTLVSVVALMVLILMGDAVRARLFIESFFYTAVACLLVGVFFPAKAAAMFLIPDIAAYPNFPSMPGILHVSYMEALRDPAASVIVLDPQALPGLVAFPSFHTASGILIMAAFWRTPLFVPALVYSTIMIAATPIYGGHYFVDLLSGVAFALFAFALVKPREMTFLQSPLMSKAPSRSSA